MADFFCTVKWLFTPLPTDVTFGVQDESPIMFVIKMTSDTRAVNSFIAAEVFKVNSHVVDCLSCKRLV